MEILEPPEGCLEIKGFILVIVPGECWLTQEGKVTSVFSERGVWETVEASNEVKDGFFEKTIHF